MKKKLNLVMPMGGGGTRFGNMGYVVPKPMIEICGSPFFHLAAQSIAKYVDLDSITFVVLKDHVERFHISDRIKVYYPTANIIVIPHVLSGAVLTCCEGIKSIDNDKPILFNDCDHFFKCKSFYEYCSLGNFNEIDGALLTFSSDSPNYSYVKFDVERHVIGTMEKVVVSDEAICGAYYFRNKDLFNQAVATYLEKCTYDEYFMSGVYNIMIEMGMHIMTFRTDEHIAFGTPEEYDLAQRCKFQ